MTRVGSQCHRKKKHNKHTDLNAINIYIIIVNIKIIRENKILESTPRNPV
jgi:hypothetical protein